MQVHQVRDDGHSDLGVWSQDGEKWLGQGVRSLGTQFVFSESGFHGTIAGSGS